MKLAIKATVFVFALVLPMLMAVEAADDPVFVKWLVAGDPGDETIRVYWEGAKAGELDPLELVDLGTMLFERGWPKDAIHCFKQALDQDPTLSEAWFRIGVVHHREGDLADARSAYKKCLKLQSGHGWANFYLGLLEEQSGDSAAALEHFERAFKHAPELADPRINPEVLSSNLQLGARLRHFDGERFEHALPMRFMEPGKVRKTRQKFEPEPPVVEVVPEEEQRAAAPAADGAAAGTAAPRRVPAAGSAAGAATGAPRRRSRPASETVPTAEETPYGVPRGHQPEGVTSPQTSPTIGSTSPEANLGPRWPGLRRLVEALV